ncbi:MAG: hypothetical protein P4L40_03165 [Terracidiphilus sp.]|nr:hypothetical protein [Terracidiphilus sp.]
MKSDEHAAIVTAVTDIHKAVQAEASVRVFPCVWVCGCVGVCV